jgi:hypothetical protein
MSVSTEQRRGFDRRQLIDGEDFGEGVGTIVLSSSIRVGGW